uniref:Hypothetical arginine/serine rich protein n=1 Tax=Burkholderia pseudomallei TaxID=28450 RepID=Q1ZZ86_BURPE|nr:hypothetical arginine/serine rich protein [Burkholderia pseudomallei]
MREREIARASAHAARIAPSRRARRAAHGGTRRGLKPPPARRMQKRHMPRSAIHGAPIVAPPRPLRRPHPGHARRPFTRRPRMRLRMRSNAHGRACATRRRPARRAIATNRESARRGLPRSLEFDCTDRGCATESKFLEMSAQPARRARSTMQARARTTRGRVSNNCDFRAKTSEAMSGRGFAMSRPVGPRRAISAGERPRAGRDRVCRRRPHRAARATSNAPCRRACAHGHASASDARSAGHRIAQDWRAKA